MPKSTTEDAGATPEGPAPGPSAFNGRDVDLLTAVITSNELMLATAQAVKLIEAITKYPIGSADALGAGFERFGGRGRRVRLARCLVSLEQAQKYMPAQAFPIQDREQLISSLLLAFETERQEVTQQLVQRQASQGPAPGKPAS